MNDGGHLTLSSPHLGFSLRRTPSSPSQSLFSQHRWGAYNGIGTDDEEGVVVDEWDLDMDMDMVGNNGNDENENHAPTPRPMGSDPAVKAAGKTERAQRGVLLDLDMHPLEAGGRALVR